VLIERRSFRVSIFEGFEPESDEEDEQEEEHENPETEEQASGLSKKERERIEQLAIQDFPDDEPFEPEPESEPEETGTGIQTSQLRHFVIQVSLSGWRPSRSSLNVDLASLQEYVPRPILVDPRECMGRTGTQLEGHKVCQAGYGVWTLGTEPVPFFSFISEHTS
jgi:hypothetical protein